MASRRSLPVRRVGPDRFRITFGRNERAQLRSFLDQLRELLADATEAEGAEPVGGIGAAGGAGESIEAGGGFEAAGTGPGHDETPDADRSGSEGHAPAAIDGRLQRLFPPAYLDDPERQGEYHRFMHHELLISKMADLDLVEATLDARELDEAGLMAWMRATNTVRLVLGTMLDVQEDTDLGRLDEDDPRLHGYLVYEFLGMIVAVIVDALAE